MISQPTYEGQPRQRHSTDAYIFGRQLMAMHHLRPCIDYSEYFYVATISHQLVLSAAQCSVWWTDQSSGG